MSAPLQLTSHQLVSLARFLAAATEATRATGVRVDAYGPVSLRLDEEGADVVMQFAWHEATEQYVIDDRIGS